MAKTDPKKEEGWIRLWSHKGEHVKAKNIAFDSLDSIPKKIRKILLDSGIEWPTDGA